MKILRNKLSVLPLAAALISTTPVALADYIVRQPISSVPLPPPTYILTVSDQSNAPLPEGYAFGAVPLPETSTGTIRLTNRGTGSVKLTGISLSGDTAFALTGGSAACAADVVLTPNTSCFVYPAFTPSAGASYTASLSVTGDHDTSASVSLAGSGTTSVALNAFDNSGNPLTGAVAYLDTRVGQTAAASHVGRIQNTGTGAATLTSRSIDNPAFSILNSGGTNNCGTVTSLSPGQYCEVYVTFTPTAVGSTSATYTLAASGGHQATLALTGNGLPAQVERVISANTADVNLAALFGNPTTADTYVLTIEPGVYVTASTTANAALTTGAFPAGSLVKIINNGYIVGRGGAGGIAPTGWVAGNPGGAGGTALALQFAVTLDNSAGAIYGGGGGGGSGGTAALGILGFRIGGNGGAGADELSSGTAGLPGVAYLTYHGGTGGNGGSFGQAGAAGAAGYGSVNGTAGGAGGAAGRAIVTNGNSLTWLGGSNTAQVKGAVQ